MEIGGRPLFEYFLKRIPAATSGKRPDTLIEDPLLARDDKAMERLRQIGNVLDAPDNGPSLDTNAFPTRSGDSLRLDYPWDLLAIMREIVESQVADISPDAAVEPGVEITGNVRVDTGARVLSGARLKGDVYIGKGVTIDHNAIIRGPVSIGADSNIGFVADLKNTLLLPDCSVGPVAIVPDCIVDERCDIGGTVRLSNTRLDRETIAVLVNGESIDSNLTPLGVFVGANATLGAGVAVLPGRKVGHGTFVEPRVIVTRNVAPMQHVAWEQSLTVEDYGGS